MVRIQASAPTRPLCWALHVGAVTLELMPCLASGSYWALPTGGRRLAGEVRAVSIPGPLAVTSHCGFPITLSAPVTNPCHTPFSHLLLPASSLLSCVSCFRQHWAAGRAPCTRSVSPFSVLPVTTVCYHESSVRMTAWLFLVCPQPQVSQR